MIRFTLKTPPKNIQEKFLSSHLEELDNKITNAGLALKKVPYSIMGVSDVNKLLQANNMSFVDIEFPPNDVGIVQRDQHIFEHGGHQQL